MVFALKSTFRASVVTGRGVIFSGGGCWASVSGRR